MPSPCAVRLSGRALSHAAVMVLLLAYMTPDVSGSDTAALATAAGPIQNASFPPTTTTTTAPPFSSTAPLATPTVAPTDVPTQQPTEPAVPVPPFAAAIVGGERDVSLDGFELRAEVGAGPRSAAVTTVRWACCRAAFLAGGATCTAPCSAPLDAALRNSSALTVIVLPVALEGAALGSLYVRVSVAIAGFEGASNDTVTLRLAESGTPPVLVVVLGLPDWRDGVQRFAALVPTDAAVTYTWRINSTALNAAASSGATARIPLQALSLAWFEGALAPQPWRVSVQVCLVANASLCATAQLWFRASVKYPNASASCAVVAASTGAAPLHAGSSRISVSAVGLPAAGDPGAFATHRYSFLLRIPGADNATVVLGDDADALPVASVTNVTLPVLPTVIAAAEVDAEVLLVVVVGGNDALTLRCAPLPFVVAPATAAIRAAVIAENLQALQRQQANASSAPQQLMEAALKVPWSTLSSLGVLAAMVNASDRCAAATGPACQFDERTNIAIIDTLRWWGMDALPSPPLVDSIAVPLSRLVNETIGRLTTPAGGNAAFQLLAPLRRILVGTTALDAVQLVRNLSLYVQALIAVNNALGEAATVVSSDGTSTTTSVRQLMTSLGGQSVSHAGFSVRFPAAFSVATQLGLTSLSTSLSTITAATFRAASDAGLPATAQLIGVAADGPPATLASGLVDVTVAVDGAGGVAVRDLDNPIEIVIPLDASSSSSSAASQGLQSADSICAYFNTTRGAWATDGVAVSSTVAGTVVCATKHLTTFAVFSRRQQPAPVPTTTTTSSMPAVSTPVLTTNGANPQPTTTPAMAVEPSSTLPSSPAPLPSATSAAGTTTAEAATQPTTAQVDEVTTASPPWTRGPFAANFDEPWLTAPVLFGIIVGVCAAAAAVGVLAYLSLRRRRRPTEAAAAEHKDRRSARQGFSEL